jgi:hypothetical protein
VSERLLYARIGYINREYLSWLSEAIKDEFRLIKIKKVFYKLYIFRK